MKKLIQLTKLTSVICFFVILYGCNKQDVSLQTDALFEPFSQQELYYWHEDDKILISQDPSLVLIEIDGATLEQAQDYLPLSQTKGIRIGDNNKLQLITSTENALSVFARYTTNSGRLAFYPAIKIAGNESTAFITNRISVKFPDNSASTAIDAIAQKYNLTFVKETLYGAHIFESSNAKQALKAANAIYENEDVLWSGPDFIMLFNNNSIQHNPPK